MSAFRSFREAISITNNIEKINSRTKYSQKIVRSEVNLRTIL